ncbi:MAG: GerAB/ArcD/ProY family transporter [Oscillospiraceae bacterium]|jgi:hypothetical protein|nr:GerAB/ArcD/ProY family transporter [Oscillospiraceae bacterium]
MKEHSKISVYQLAALLILTRLFSETMNFTGNAGEYSMQRFAVIVVTYCILAVATLPAFFVMKKARDAGIKDGFFRIIMSKNKVWGWILFALVAFQLSLWALYGVSGLEFMVTNTILESAEPALVILLFMIAAIYGFSKGINAVARFGPPMFAAYLIGLVTVCIALFHQMDFTLLYPTLIENDSFFSDICAEIIKNNEMLIFLILEPRIDKHPWRTPFVTLPITLVIKLVISAVTMTVFGPYLNKLSFPLFSIASLADIVVFERLDGIDIAIWTVSAIVKLILVLICIREFGEMLVGIRKAKIIAYGVAIVIGVSAVVNNLSGHKLLSFDFTVESLIFSSFVMVILPLVAFVIVHHNIKQKKICKE